MTKKIKQFGPVFNLPNGTTTKDYKLYSRVWDDIREGLKKLDITCTAYNPDVIVLYEGRPMILTVPFVQMLLDLHRELEETRTYRYK